VTPEELEAETQDWLREWQLSGVDLTILRPSGEGWTAALGTHVDGSPFVIGELYDIASVTKTFTAAIVLRLAERGLLSLDDPLSRFVPDFPQADLIPIRTLIQHTSGLIATDATSPHDALDAATAEGLQFEPGHGFIYSSPGYYLLGLVIEQVLSVNYTQALHQELLDPLGLAATVMDEEVSPLGYSTHPYRAVPEGYEGVVWTSGGLFREIVPEFEYQGLLWSSAGLFSSTSDLARWGIYLWGSDRVVSAATLDAMTTFLGPEFQYAGLATYPYCPCWWENGRLKAERWGHLGLTGALEWDPVDHVSLAVSTTGTVVDENVIRALDDLSMRLRRLIRGREMPLVEPGARP
jgi:CubicO group peptidase (beta-lactamase class C family)